jgi:excisionase family DNA binding protein
MQLPLIEATAATHNNQPAKPEQLQLFLSSRYLNIEQVAEIIGLPKSFIYRRIARGHDDPIPHYRLGGHLRFKLDDVEEWIERHRNEPERESPAALVAAIKRSLLVRALPRIRTLRTTHDLSLPQGEIRCMSGRSKRDCKQLTHALRLSSVHVCGISVGLGGTSDCR